MSALRRLTLLDRALVLILLPIWAIGFVISVKLHLEGRGIGFVGLSLADAGSYPVYNGEPDLPGLRGSALLPGDALIRVGRFDLRGVNSLGFFLRSIEESGGDASVHLVYRRGTEERETVLPVTPISRLRPWLAGSVVSVAVALFLFLKARPTPLMRVYLHLALCLAFVFGVHPAGMHPVEIASFWLQTCAQVLAFPLALRFAFLFPDDRAPPGRWHRVWPWLFAVLGPIWVATLATGRLSVYLPLYGGTIGAGVVAFLAVTTGKYRSADAVARRQFRWIVAGAYLALLPMALTSGLLAIDFRFERLWLASFWFRPLLPVFILISVVRFNMFDVDRLLSATASYNVLLVLLGAGALVVVPRVAETMSGVAGVDPGVGQVVLSLALAAAVIPAHRSLRPQIERVFFKERYALDQGVADLLPKLSACRDARELTECAGAGLHGLLRPEACVVYAAIEGSYAPVFAEGRAVPSAFAAESPLIGTLRARRAPLSLSAVGRRPDLAALDPFDRAALETLGAEVVVPVRQGDALPAFLCLGPKRSGDVYTSTDLSLLAAVAETVSQQLQRFDQDAVIREAREMQESLRRYVPGAIAEQLTSGAELGSGEREVTVLFVDIRGYTGFAESRRAEEIFSTVNRYTETASEIVQRHAGSVVEFNGDGMMAVFGAPRELAHKERAAVEAGREIVAAVGAVPVDRNTPLSVGVGIATGEAFVGNIRAVDRMIWSAIGNTTNLAARLQSLTRELDAAVVIDAATWQRAQPAAADFERRPAVPIRGRRETQDLYALALRGEP